jgi:3-deoxy-D-manno-octulosonic acid kinase
MQLKQQATDSRAIVYDADRIQQPDSRLFEPDYWASAGAVAGKAQGRGNTLLLETPFGPAVLRQYLRGGFVARFSRDRYLYLGYERSRPVAEARTLASLYKLGLPVPEILGAICQRRGWIYSGALLTSRIPAAVPLAELLGDLSQEDSIWFAIGVCIRRFHEHGVCHADLNVRNILLDAQKRVWLIDFDRARMLQAGHRALAGNLQRLQRSLRKEGVVSEAQLEACWSQLMLGYNNVNKQSDTSGVEKKT